MHISRVNYENFRNLESLDQALDRGSVVVNGPNGSGKTNFLEGIYFGSCLRRFPESNFEQLYKDKKTHFRIRLYFEDGHEHVLDFFSELQDGRHRYKLKHNQQEVVRSKYQGCLPVISFLPQDLALLTRSPGGRRRFLDEILSTTAPAYRHALYQYEKTLKQRNELLANRSTGAGSGENFEVWDRQLAKFGSEVCSWRRKFLDFINANLSSVIDPISPDLLGIQLVYKKSGDTGENGFLEKLFAAKQREEILKTTVVGPHRDDFFAEISGKGAVGYLSRGQLRSITLALKVLEKQYFEEVRGRTPILLLDDVFSEFDENHQGRIIEYLKTFEQVFFTTAHLEEVERYLPEQAQLFNIQNGEMSRDV